MEVEEYVPWAPQRLVDRQRPKSEFKTLPWIWLANEIGRAMVRAIEVGIQANSLLDRDRFRLLNTLANGATLFYRPSQVQGLHARRTAGRPLCKSIHLERGRDDPVPG
jgi:hypothetical protein